MDRSTDMASNLPILWIVIPCFNEQEVLPITAPKFLDVLNELISVNSISADSRICFVNDGSKDNTWEIINSLSRSDSHYSGISLSRNRGHQNALLAGLMEARRYCDLTVSIDCDGQDDIHKIVDMVECYLGGSEVVYGVRSSRETDSFFKRFTAESFYKLLNSMGAEVVFNHADFRLLGSRVLDALSEFKEVNLYLRGLIPQIGFKSSCVEYEREERIAGKSHYPLMKMINLAFDGITSLSVKPIHFITVLGLMFSVVGLIGIVWAIVTLLLSKTVAGWASLLCFICFFGGVQMCSLGIIGEYIGKIYLEVKHRPRFIISERTYD